MEKVIFSRRTVHGLAGLAASVPVTMRVRGDCMHPSLSDGMQVLLAPRRFYWPGDVVVRHATDRGLIAHRIIGCYLKGGRLRYLTQADASARPDISVTRDAIIGKVLSVQRYAEPPRISLRDRLRALGRFVSFIVARTMRQ